MDKIELQKFIGNSFLTVSEAMQEIGKNANGILFLIDENKKLSSCITDGDIRRFLLSGGKMDDVATKASNHNPKYAKNHEEAKLLYHKRNYIAIPILDDQGTILDIYTGETGVAKKQHNALNIPVVINAGGKGTRLDPFTRVLPKPLIPVGELPIIELIMQEYQSYKCSEFHIIVNYKKDLMR